MESADHTSRQSTDSASDGSPLATRMVRGTLAQQGGLVVATLTGLVVTTALARSLSLREFGVYGFVVALSTYLYFVIGTAETSAVNEMATAGDRDELDLAFTRSIIVYIGLGAVAGLVVAVGGSLLVQALDFSAPLTRQAQIGAVAVGGLTAIGWTTKVFQDYLRATHRFAEASASEAIGNIVLLTVVLVAVAAGAPLWVLIATGGALPFYVGLTGLVWVTLRGDRVRLRPRDVRAADLRSFLRYSGGLLVFASSDLVVSSLDRTVVGALRSATTLGLYEAASKINALMRALVANLSVTMLPVLSRTRAENEHERERTLLILGTRYMLVAAVGPTVTLMVLCDRVLEVWLGARYVAAAPTAVIFLAWWLVAPNLSIATTMVIVSRELRKLTILAWFGAAVNLALSIALTAWLGLIGVAIGTLIGALATVPYLVSFAFAGRGVSVADFARSAWRPAYGLGVVLAIALFAVRSALPLDHLWSVVAVASLGVIAYWVAFYILATDAGERALLRSFLRR